MKKARSFAFLVALLLATAIVSCSPTQKPSDTETAQESLPTPIAGSVYGEAPLLAERVAAGELPPVEERLPTNPVLIQPVERVGVYGGTWHMGLKRQKDVTVLRVYAGYENLLRWNPEWNRIIPNLAQSYEVNENSTEFIFHLREGLKWSDGAPFTADDILFWWEVENLDDRIWPNVNRIFTINDVPAVIEKIDDTTVRISFTEPYGRFPYEIASVKTDYCLTASPMHYLKQFHIDYNPEGIDSLVAEAGVADWVALYKMKNQRQRNPDIPTMNAWVLATPYHSEPKESQTTVIMERNPYYWKIDTEYNQLPYIDQINFTIYPSTEALHEAAMAGQIDMQHTLLNIADNYQEYRANMETSGYELHTMFNERSNALAIQLNLTHQDPGLRDIFVNKSFRIALSQSINRPEVINHVYGMALEPSQPAPRRESPYFREELAKQYTEFDQATANALLDEAGYDQRDVDGCRLTSEGRRIDFSIAVSSRYGDDVLKAAEMVAEYWHSVGICVDVIALTSVEYTHQISENQHDVVIQGTPGGIDAPSQPGIYMPNNPYNSYFAIPWVNWYIDNSLGEKPPDPALTQIDLYEQLKATSDFGEIAHIMDQILAIAEDQFYVMGISQPPDVFMLVKSNFHNVPLTMPAAWVYPSPAPTNPCQYFIESYE